jgi:hypothetical protein
VNKCFDSTDFLNDSIFDAQQSADTTSGTRTSQQTFWNSCGGTLMPSSTACFALRIKTKTRSLLASKETMWLMVSFAGSKSWEWSTLGACRRSTVPLSSIHTTLLTLSSVLGSSSFLDLRCRGHWSPSLTSRTSKSSRPIQRIRLFDNLLERSSLEQVLSRNTAPSPSANHRGRHQSYQEDDARKTSIIDLIH